MKATDPLSTSSSLLNQVRSGEELAWFRLVHTYTPLIHRWARQQGVRETETEDIAQNVFVAVAKHINRFGHSREENSFRAWLWSITRSKIMDQLRFTKKGPNAVGGMDLLCFEAAKVNASANEIVRNSSELADDLKLLIVRALEIIRHDFSEQTWTAFWLTAALGRSPGEVSKELGMTAAAVCMCRARVLRRLRETIRLD
jgi:RNA polymerase sigma-70 factor (ECF subfamily)